jgi:hypothetical protein
MIQLSHLTLIGGETINLGYGARTTLTANGTELELSFDPTTALIYVVRGQDVHVLPSSTVKSMRVAPAAVPELVAWMDSKRAGKKTRAA